VTPTRAPAKAGAFSVQCAGAALGALVFKRLLLDMCGNLSGECRSGQKMKFFRKCRNLREKSLKNTRHSRKIQTSSVVLMPKKLILSCFFFDKGCRKGCSR
jgi:hypothetical protein